ncbi:MHS family alpha-ketoglutarate permease-like MFS transporter [Curtobacterium sp. PhB130]|uniref:MFS transporter n=1 Tax=unclassified Curtobacterium TaxID=257496 RepID=UPI000F4BB962|nr:MULTISPECIES: MFS transporter [unclassified Curtobacterium]ROS74078.1 MHS family alpha-ketoglutarate permease-like MFS transporter [Curtobacterium sp. PhB130]TCK62894.1 MHS family alpha-ketoglutarate permease-like MFS transporter [Curtobacterium sp. PhB136]
MTAEAPNTTIGATGAGSTAVHETRLSARGRKAILAGGIGNVVEWIDWAVYTTFSSVFGHHFFPPGNDAAALLATLAVFAVGFVMRPVGAAVLGVYADRHGRKKGLMLTIGLMAAASLLIGITPDYGTIGIAAPIILLLARLVQGFSAGGEFGSSSAFLVESAAPKRRAFAGSWQQVSVGAGVLIASGIGAIITSVLSPAALDAWGWRVAFVFCALIGLVGIWLRTSVQETESFTAQRARDEESAAPKRNPVAAMFRDHPGATARVFGITIAGTLLYYMWVSYMPTYAHVTTGLPLNQALIANVIAMVVFLVLLPFAGILSDRIGRKPTMSIFAGGFLLFAWPAFTFLNGTFWSLLIIQVIGILFLLGYSANCAVIMAEQFPPEVRATGIGLPYALAVAIFGGTAPYITTWMSGAGFGNLVWVYCAVAAAIGLVVYLTMPETKGKVLR